MRESRYRYRPIEGKLSDWTGPQLAVLRDVSEGWYVDYKVAGLSARGLGKHMSAFANQYGGWLFIGIQDSGDADMKAAAFPGVPDSQLAQIRQRVTSAVVDHITPQCWFEERVIRGPVPEIGLDSGNSILVLGIPEGLQPPYVHSSGRVYIRAADSSDPSYIRDHRDLTQLWGKREKARERLESFVSDTPRLSQGESDLVWAHVYLVPDLHVHERDLDLPFDEFRKILAAPAKEIGVHLPMDSFFPSRFGFTARQVAKNDPSLLCLAFRWWHSGNARISIPVNTHSLDSCLEKLRGYRYSEEFYDALVEQRFDNIRIADLAKFFHHLAAMLRSYLDLRATVGDTSELYARVVLENTWRVSAFIDDAEYIKQVCDTGAPVVEEQTVLFPNYVDFDTLIELRTEGFAYDDTENQGEGQRELPEALVPYWVAAPLAYGVLSSLGVLSDPRDFARYTSLLDPDVIKRAQPN